jgi:hypothetical protein
MVAESPHRSVETEDGSVMWTRNTGAGGTATEELNRRMLPGTQRLGRASRPTWRGISSERPRLPRKSCFTPPRSRGRRPVNLGHMKSPERLRGS